jgi:hypothetical protein
LISAPLAARQGALDAGLIGSVAGVEATTTADGVVRIGWPRTDVEVMVDGVVLAPFAGLGSWAAFSAIEGGAVVAGDTVVFEDEVDAAIDAAFAAGLEVTALHNHFFFDDPRVFFLHLGGRGDSGRLAMGVRAVWDAVRGVRATISRPRRRFAEEIAVSASSPLSREPLAAVLGSEPAESGGVLKFTRGLPTHMAGTPMGASMGVSTWAAFSGSDSAAAVSGDFAMLRHEVQTVLRALRRGGLHIVALHHHMIDEDPPVFFVHFWGKGSALELATAVRSVLDAQSP